MKKVININFQGQVIAIEETAYEILKQYIQSLKQYFSREESGEEIVNDIECRIAELFGNRLKLGIPCITDEDVEAIIASIGKPEDFDSNYEEVSADAEKRFASESENEKSTSKGERHQLFRNANDKIIGGVCSGLADYFKIDPIWVRIIFVAFFGFLFWVYIFLWIFLKPRDLGNNEGRRLYRNTNGKVLGGVCNGMADYFRVDPTLVRAIAVLITLVFGGAVITIFTNQRDLGIFSVSPIIIYIILWIVLTPQKTQINVKKRLYRNPNDKFIAGVCGGIASYFKIDAWIPRMAFLAPFIIMMLGTVPFLPFRFFFDNDFGWKAGFLFVFTYLILWLIIPKAVSVKQKLEMLGEEDYIQSIRETVSDNVENMKNRAENEHETGYNKEEKKPTSNNQALVKYKPSSSPSGNSGCLKALGVFFKVIFFTIVGFLGMSLLVGATALLFVGAQLFPLKSLFIDAGTETTLLILSAILLLAIPIIAIIVWIIRRSVKAKSRPVIGVVALLLWLSGVVLAGILTFSVVSKFREEGTNEKNIAISPIASTKMYVDLLPYTNDYSVISLGFDSDTEIHDLPYITVNQDSLLSRFINLQIRETTDSLFSARVTMAARGKNLRLAKENASHITYNIVQKDSLLLLPEFFSVPMSQGFRDQTVIVDIFVPAGKSVEVGEALNKFERRMPPRVVRRRGNR